LKTEYPVHEPVVISGNLVSLAWVYCAFNVTLIQGRAIMTNKSLMANFVPM